MVDGFGLGLFDGVLVGLGGVIIFVVCCGWLYVFVLLCRWWFGLVLVVWFWCWMFVVVKLFTLLKWAGSLLVWWGFVRCYCVG